MTRVMMALTVSLLLSLFGAFDALAGGGANNPPFGPCDSSSSQGCRTIEGPEVSGTFSLDPHNEGVTTTAGNIFEIKLKLKTGATSSVKAKGSALPDVGYSLGCLASLTPIRFEYHPQNETGDAALKQTTLYDFVIPSSIVDDLFTALGLVVDQGIRDPVITFIPSAVCTVDPKNRTTTDGSTPGVLQFEAVIQFRVPCTFGDENCSSNPDIP